MCNNLFVDKQKQKKNMKKKCRSSSTSSSMLSTKEMQMIVDKLSMERCRDSTRKTYHRIWKIFNHFILRLDHKLKTWEEQLILFTGYLVNNNLHSAMVKTYISAIRGVLMEVGIKINENKYLMIPSPGRADYAMIGF